MLRLNIWGLSRFWSWSLVGGKLGRIVVWRIGPLEELVSP